jgi:zinc metalloprotease ZmpA
MVAAVVSAGVSAGASGPAAAEPVPAVSSPAVSAADALVADRPGVLFAGPDDGFVRQPVQSSMGWDYVPYLRTYKGLPVLGGDFVVVVDREGQVSSTSVAQRTVIGGLDVVPRVTRASAEQVAVGQLARGVALEGVRGSRLVVDATGEKSRLVWQSVVAGRGPGAPSLLEVVVDAVTGTVVRTDEQVLHDIGHSGLNGGRVTVPSVRINCGTGACPPPEIWTLGYPAGGGMSCDVRKVDPEVLEWGNGDPTDSETACVDMMFAAITENSMLANWLGRNGLTGLQDVGGFPMFTDSSTVDDAYYVPGGPFNQGEVHLGRRPNGMWLASLDIVGHENGHGVDDHTPSGVSHPSTREFIADAFGLATEWYANRPAPYDTPDYVIADTSALGLPDHRKQFLYDPARNGRGVNCYSSAVPSMNEDDAAGVGNHWLYLLAEGSNPTNGHPVSPTCDGSTVSPIGLRTAMRVLYNAMLMKNSNSTYPSYRSWTLTAARNLFPHDCNIINTVRKAWDAVGVPAQPGEPACVPSLSGLPAHAAHLQVLASRLALGSTTHQVSHASPGTIIGQSPAPGAQVPVGTPVNFVVSLGAVQIPHVFNRSCADASNVIRSVGLVPSCTGAGPKVTAVSPMVGNWVAPGSVITLTLSTVRHVPDVVGVSCSTAMGWLRDNDLVGQCSGSGPVVTRQTPGAGVTVNVGALVQLSTTAPPRPPQCPDAGTQACPRP